MPSSVSQPSRPVIAAFAVVVGWAAAWVAPARAAERPDHDRLDVRVDADTYLRLFQRAPLPGAGGAIVLTRRSAPWHQYTTLQVDDVDLPWQPDSLDVELSTWGSVDFAQTSVRRRVDGDVQAAWVRHRAGPVYVRLGRQYRAGGAARFVHFDGAAAGVQLPSGLGLDAYAGLAVLPRWSNEPGYHVLGSATDSMLRTPEAVLDHHRSEEWLGGGRLHYRYDKLVQVGTSYHEQHELGGLGRRNLGIDATATPHEMVSATARAIVDADAWGLTEARVFVDVMPLDSLTITTEYLHTTPALFLSRQSVLSVFSTDPYDELGGVAGYRLADGWWIGAGGYADLFADGHVGGRLRGDLRVSPPGLPRLMVRAGYRRVGERFNGYHAPRLAASYRVIDPLQLSADSYLYFYDEAVRDVTTAWMGTANAEWSFEDGVAVLLGGSLRRSPYLALDAQALARVSVDLDWRIR